MAGKLMVQGFKEFVGKHCETSALKRVLERHGLSLSEEMLLGLSGGIGFIYWYMKLMPSPFVGGRYGKGTDFPKNICKRIGADMTVFETSSPKKGYEELKAILRSAEPAVVYGDIAYLPYFAVPEIAHFGGHVFVVFGLDIEYPSEIANLEAGIKESIWECCQNMLNPPIKNIGLDGIEKWSKIVTKWPEQFEGVNLFGCLMNGFMYIEISGTGGSAFRSMYAQFLEEASSIINKPALKEVAEMMGQSAEAWSEIASGFLPDSWPALKRTRELIVQKNKLFEDQGPGALEAMRKINGELDELMGKAVEDLQKPPIFLGDVQQSILKCYEIEKKALNTLSSVIKQ